MSGKVLKRVLKEFGVTVRQVQEPQLRITYDVVHLDDLKTVYDAFETDQEHVHAVLERLWRSSQLTHENYVLLFSLVSGMGHPTKTESPEEREAYVRFRAWHDGYAARDDGKPISDGPTDPRAREQKPRDEKAWIEQVNRVLFQYDRGSIDVRGVAEALKETEQGEPE